MPIRHTNPVRAALAMPAPAGASSTLENCHDADERCCFPYFRQPACAHPARRALDDLRAHDCHLLTIGQYLRPSKFHLPVLEYVHPDRFAAWQAYAESIGFESVASGPLVRSSYHADLLAGTVKPGESSKGAD